MQVEISSERLRIPLTRTAPHNNPEEESFVIDEVVKQCEAAGGDAVVLVDVCAIRHDVRKELNEFLRKTGFPVYAAPMGKTIVDEHYQRYGGVYLGAISHGDVREKVESAKLVITVGSRLSDFNTGNFSYKIKADRTIQLHSDHTTIQYAAYLAIGMKQLIPKLTVRLESYYERASKIQVPLFASPVPKETHTAITHAWFWPRVGQFFRPKDVIVTETGTANFGILDVQLPEQSVLLTQMLWESIGWSVGSTLGAALAAKEVGLKRSILFVGDGSLQLTVQELSVMLRVGVKPIIFVLNNGGYTIERYIDRSITRKYNDISNWNWTGLFKVLGDPEEKISCTYTVRTKEELSALLDDTRFASTDKIQLVEVMMDKLDAPRAMQAELSGQSYDTTSNLARAVWL